MKILIAEDSPDTQAILEIVLEKQGYDFVIVADGNAAWEILQGEDVPEMVILDWLMPGMDGIELCRRVRSQPALKQLYIVMLTGRDAKDEILQGFEAGADDYITKPFDVAQLNARIEVGRRIIGLQNDLAQRIRELEESQRKIVQQEKMASIGQLSAGVAHEINNPIGFVSNNLKALGGYLDKLNDFVEEAQNLFGENNSAAFRGHLEELHRQYEVHNIINDIKYLVEESLDGTARVEKIVRDLKSFSRSDGENATEVDLNECIESSLRIVWNELKYKASVIKDYNDLPRITAHIQQLNQVFLNLLVNAAQSIEGHGDIVIHTWHTPENVLASITDTGCGITGENLAKIWDPFFTTKEPGVGIGLGLSISFDIVRKYGGEITVESREGEGSTFTVRLPLSGGGAEDG